MCTINNTENRVKYIYKSLCACHERKHKKIQHKKNQNIKQTIKINTCNKTNT